MTAAPFDPIAFKSEQRANWNGISSGWESWQDRFERGAAVVTEQLLDLAGVRPGQAVLDLGTGIGEPALSAARVVGPTGRVVGVDLAPEMIAAARRRAGDMANLEFTEGDADCIDLAEGTFDVALSRWGLMFAVDHVAMFRSLARVLVPGGVLAAAVWGPPARAPMMSLGFQVLSSRLELPPAPPDRPGPFSMTDPAEITRELTEAGFVEISVTEFEVPFLLDSAQEYVEFTMAVLPQPLRSRLTERFGSPDDPETWRAIGSAAAGFGTDGGGIALPSTALCLRAVTVP